MNCIGLDGDLESLTVNYTNGSLCPALQLNLASVISVRSVSRDVFKLGEYKVGRKVKYHTMEFGEYPKTYVGDKLNESFRYDNLDNPEEYRGYTLSWSHGRQLDEIKGKASFTYNINGLRTSKTANGFTTSYILNGNKILEQSDALNTMKFYYGIGGVVGFHLKSLNNDGSILVDNDFYYKKNAQNDIVGLYSNENKLIARYFYDAWGNQKCQYLANDGQFVDILDDYMYNDTSIINRFIAFKNSFRYRGYYFDYETNFYYLNTCYYDPEIGRFINADDISILNTAQNEINGLNLYAYCFNNPVNDFDENGNWSWKKFFKAVTVAVVVVAAVAAVTVASGGTAAPVIVGAIVGASVSAGVSAVTQLATTGTIDPYQTMVDFAFGAIGGAFGGSALGVVGMSISGAITSGASSIASSWVAGESISWENVALNTILGAIVNARPGAQNGLLSNRISILNSKKNILLNNSLGKYSNRGFAGAMNLTNWRLQNATRILNFNAISSIIFGILDDIQISFYTSLI